MSRWTHHVLAGEGWVWVVEGREIAVDVNRIDPKLHRITGEPIRLPRREFRAAAVGMGHLWVCQPDKQYHAVLAAVNAQSGQIKEVKGNNHVRIPHTVVIGDQDIWIGSVLRGSSFDRVQP